MAWPAILSMSISALYNIVDSIFVGMISEEALTAVSLANPIQMVIISFAVGSGVGVNSLISRRLGAHRQAEADQAASTGLWIALFNGILFLILGLIFTKPFVHMYYEDGFIAENAISYMSICLCLSVFICFQCVIEKTLQATGNMKSPMFISLSGAITNIIFDPLLIFGIGPFPELGVAGAAIATVFGQFVACTIAFIILLKGEHIVTITIKGFKLDWGIVKDIYGVGFPSILMQSIGSVMLIGYNAILAAFSETAVAVLGVYFKLQSFIFMPVFGLNQGLMPLMGYNYGAANKKRLMSCYKHGLVLAYIFMGIGFAIFQIFPEYLLKLFSAGPEMLEVGIPALRIISICFWPAAFGIITSTTFQASGHGFYSLFSSLIRQLVGILPLAYILSRIGGVALSWAAFPLAEILGTCYIIIVFRHLYKTEISKL
ncbi:MAG: MATE family efflux transporter [Clostridia bacterium]|nr:MATE family efflux transporter [Clostridia bacterium]